MRSKETPAGVAHARHNGVLGARAGIEINQQKVVRGLVRMEVEVKEEQ